MKRQTTPTLLVAVVIGLGSPSGFGQEPTPGDGPTYAPMPWHLVDVWWDIGKDVRFESYSLDVTISDDVPSSSKLYIAPIGLAHLGQAPFYGGLQSQADGHTKRDPRIRQIGPGFIFSMWGERSLDAIRPPVGGFCQSSGHEGDFVSVRRPYEWRKGTYTYKVVRMDREEVDGQPYTWVGVLVYSHGKDENVFAGALRFRGENLVLSRNLASFVEVYGRRIPAGEIPRVTVTFSNPVVNGKPVEVASASAIYPEGVPDYAEAQAQGDRLVIAVGQRVEGRTKRTVRLIPDGVGPPK